MEEITKDENTGNTLMMIIMMIMTGIRVVGTGSNDCIE